MSAISETIVREFLEASGFLVQQGRKFVAPSRRHDSHIDFFASHPAATESKATLPFELRPADLKHIPRAVFAVKGWHTETFSPAVMVNSPEIFRFAQPAAAKAAEAVFGADTIFLKILVAPSLPASKKLRRESVEHLRGKGVDGVIEFPAVLSAVIDAVEKNRNYQRSDVLQLIRVLKAHGMLREPQLELFRAGKPRRAARKPKP
ncbi:MAG: hypothetical protein HN707_05980 [Verrucomicrobia bacterium]|jgi:hypothetical protein|nr:hypothetical protein [Verrucomicrobiota bacterium]MBT3840969.1 hypothetical protein [Verrucomicrobiota bacterium]MBT3912814.1 hypothetical protein [Verrucomicrobiota bacterium]MBT4900490.1 hypothetical protein [Verrucomicrobiota bacterium]MBT5312481.1 hypothetical protein [Verrucomicrobiota bacterium]